MKHSHRALCHIGECGVWFAWCHAPLHCVSPSSIGNLARGVLAYLMFSMCLRAITPRRTRHKLFVMPLNKRSDQANSRAQCRRANYICKQFDKLAQWTSDNSISVNSCAIRYRCTAATTAWSIFGLATVYCHNHALLTCPVRL